MMNDYYGLNVSAEWSITDCDPKNWNAVHQGAGEWAHNDESGVRI
jgi:hypothetical protein